jgi:hypothetical protein
MNNIKMQLECENSLDEKNLEEFSTTQLNYIRDTIEGMNKFNQIEVLRILSKYKQVTLNENKNGIYINLTELEPFILAEMAEFVSYTTSQEKILLSSEKEKEIYKQKYFGKDNKDTF